MKFTVLTFSILILNCNQRNTIVNSSESFDSASFDPIIEHSQIPRDTTIDKSTHDTLNNTKTNTDSVDRKKWLISKQKQSFQPKQIRDELRNNYHKVTNSESFHYDMNDN